MKQTAVAKVMATIALLAILIWIIGTGLIFVFSSVWGDDTIYQQEVTQEELDEIIEQFSGSIDTTSSTWETQ